ncbi:MAG: GTP-binding protein [Ruminiclostridium sp.]|nr:GTP-binding protein [Ruminiclostridium sp.]
MKEETATVSQQESPKQSENSTVQDQEQSTANVENTAAEQSETIEQTKENKPGEFKKVKVKVKAIYLTGISAGSTKTLDKYIDIINKTELNTVVIDIKDNGVVNYPSAVPFVAENGLSVKYFDPEKVIKKLHDNNIYVIARLVCFRDEGLALKNTDLAVKRIDGTIWKENKRKNTGAWTNPYKEEVWKYNIDIAKEAISKGFDEIQFDYVRFPTAKKSEVSYGENVPTKVDAICSFLKLASQELHSLGVPVSADVFGIIAESRSDGEAIGQDLERVGLDIDGISPMVYPSHYANGQEVNGVVFEKPDLDPYGVVYQTMLKIKNRTALVPGYKAVVRPYLQSFTAKWLKEGYYMNYGPEQVRQQIKAVNDAGYEEWILWNPGNIYSEAIFEKE